jgi:hypothetical protein
MPTVIEKLMQLAAKLPEEVVQEIVLLVEGAVGSDNPMRYVQRRLTADAAHEGSEQLVDAALSRMAKG